MKLKGRVAECYLDFPPPDLLPHDVRGGFAGFEECNDARPPEVQPSEYQEQDERELEGGHSPFLGQLFAIEIQHGSSPFCFIFILQLYNF